jgi:putative DNA-invertase from lambdoid prophage Rac
MMHGLTLGHVFVERGVSGSTPLAERPEGSALLAILKPGDVVLTPRLDRMFRSALDALDVLAKLKARKVSLHMLDLGGDATGNGISKLVFTILSAVAEAERDRIRERVSQVKQDQRDRGALADVGLTMTKLESSARVALPQWRCKSLPDARLRGAL